MPRMLIVVQLLLFAITSPLSAQPKYNDNDRPVNTPESVRLAVEDMIKTFGDRYPRGEEYLKKLIDLEQRIEKSKEANGGKVEKALQREFAELRREALLDNPLLDFDRLLVVRRKGLAAPALNAYTNSEMRRENWDNELAIVSELRSKTPKVEPFYRPDNGGGPMRDLDLHFSGQKAMFSTIMGKNNRRWGVYEINLDGTGLRLLTPDGVPDVDYYDSCYLADGGIAFCSTAGMQGLPCENGSRQMVNIYRGDPATKEVRQLTFEQDSDWHPTLMNDGRIMYLRWEYTDIMHYFSRILFSMNPDGTNQKELYGSGSYFPTAFKNARQLPGNSGRIIGIVGGHHSRPETGRLCIIDPSMGRKYPMRFRPLSKEWGPEETYLDILPDIYPAKVTGFVQEIPGRGLDVVGNVLDGQGDGLKYNFNYPYPLSENYFLVNCQITGQWDGATYGIYLVDTFDNLTLIHEIPNEGLFEPTPIVPRDPPPVIADRTDPDSTTANVFITDVYHGPGLKDVPRGTIKKMRIFAYHYAFMNRGGHESVGVQSSWDIKRILGTVPVEDDGSCSFEVPANTPLALQPLDENGRAVQLMRSWFVGMPGENVSCIGCHESQLDVTPAVRTKAAFRAPDLIEPFYGEARPVAFETEVYEPVVRKFCLSCHTGDDPKIPSFADAKKAYDNIHPFVRRPGPETDMDLLPPYEYHTSTSELCQMLEKGHFNVALDKEAWERVHLWIDMNAPWRGKWDHPEANKRRLELSKLYANIDTDFEQEYDELLTDYARSEKPNVIEPPKFEKSTDTLRAANWPFDALTAEQMQKQLGEGKVPEMEIDLQFPDSPPLKATAPPYIKLVQIPAGEFVMGNLDGFPDEAPRAVVKIEKPFWIGTTEITNAQYEVFDPSHDTRYLEEHGKDHTTPGYIANHPRQPVARISWNEAQRFCEWLSRKTDRSVKLPTEAQWEWAARSGSGQQFFFGPWEADFSPFANLADADRRFLYTTWEAGSMIHRRRPYPEDSVYPLRDDRFKDSWFIVDYVAQSKPNPWGLYDMIGNVCEWTRSDYKAYPYSEADGRNAESPSGKKTARGGSWADRPKVTGSSTRYPYEAYQKVHNVGFRIVIE